MQSALLLLQQLKGVQLSELTLGIIGVGNVGSKIAKVGQELGMRVLKHALPRLEKEGALYPVDKQGNELKPFVYF